MSDEQLPKIFFRRLRVKWEDPIVSPTKERLYEFEDPPSLVKCEHKSRIAMDEEDRTLTCMGCGKNLDPFWVIEHWRSIYRQQASYVEAIKEHKKAEAARRKRQQDRRDKREKE